MTQKAAFLQADVARSLRAASKAPGNWSVTIDRDGVIHIIPVHDSPAPPYLQGETARGQAFWYVRRGRGSSRAPK